MNDLHPVAYHEALMPMRRIYSDALLLVKGSANCAFFAGGAVLLLVLSAVLIPSSLAEKAQHQALTPHDLTPSALRDLLLFALVDAGIAVFTIQTLMLDIYGRHTKTSRLFMQAVGRSVKRFLPAAVVTISVSIAITVLMSIAMSLCAIIPATVLAIAASRILLAYAVMYFFIGIGQTLIPTALLPVLTHTTAPTTAIKHSLRILGKPGQIRRALQFSLLNIACVTVPLMIGVFGLSRLLMHLHTDFARFALSLLMLGILLWLNLFSVAAQTVNAENLLRVYPLPHRFPWHTDGPT